MSLHDDCVNLYNMLCCRRVRLVDYQLLGTETGSSTASSERLIHTMVSFSLLLSSAVAASASAIRRNLANGNSTDTVVDLGPAGSYQGVLQNDGT